MHSYSCRGWGSGPPVGGRPVSACGETFAFLLKPRSGWVGGRGERTPSLSLSQLIVIGCDCDRRPLSRRQHIIRAWHPSWGRSPTERDPRFLSSSSSSPLVPASRPGFLLSRETEAPHSSSRLVFLWRGRDDRRRRIPAFRRTVCGRVCLLPGSRLREAPGGSLRRRERPPGRSAFLLRTG